MFCAKCGKELDDNAQGCPYCGAVVSQQQEKKRGIGSKIVGAIVILLLFGGCGALYWYDNGGKQEIELYEAQQMMKQGQYDSAMQMLERMENYEKAEQKLKECHYKLGEMFKNAEDYDTAIEEFSLAEDYLNAQ